MGTIDLDHLPLFLAVADLRSFSAAAERLGLPKSTVSRGVAALEAALGVRLLHRTSRRVAPSTAGAALAERVRPLIADLQRSLGDLPEREEQPSGVLRVTATADLATAVLAALAVRFTERYPAVQLELHLDNKIVDLVKDGIDVALRISQRPLKDGALVARKIAPIALQLFAAPEYLARRGTPRAPQELAGHRWVTYRGAATLRLHGPGEVASVQARGAITCDEMAFAREAVREGGGIGCLPTFLVEADVLAGKLVRVLPRWAVPSGTLWLAWAHSRHVPPKIAAFRDFMLASLGARTLAPRLT